MSSLRKVLYIATGLGLLVAAWRGLPYARCIIRNQHNPKRHPLGGFRCVDCGHAGADLDEMGHFGSGYVNPTRRLWDRTHGELTRTSHWEPTSRGTH